MVPPILDIGLIFILSSLFVIHLHQKKWKEAGIIALVTAFAILTVANNIKIISDLNKVNVAGTCYDHHRRGWDLPKICEKNKSWMKKFNIEE